MAVAAKVSPTGKVLGSVFAKEKAKHPSSLNSTQDFPEAPCARAVIDGKMCGYLDTPELTGLVPTFGPLHCGCKRRHFSLECGRN